MKARRYVVVFWPLRKVRGRDLLALAPDDRVGPCSSWGIPPRRSRLRTHRGRAEGFYTRHRLPDDLAALIAEEWTDLERIAEERRAAMHRIRLIERDFIATLKAPSRFTTEDGTVWTFRSGHMKPRP